MHVKIVTKENHIVDCYGHLEDNSNFHIVCENEDDDVTWCDGNPNSDDYTFSSWQEVVEILSDEIDGEIVEITTV